MSDDRIVRLLAVSPADHDICWVRESLQAAIELELATIPVYLCGLWSIKAPTPDDPNSAYALIRSVVLEEMLHMGLACNMLNAVGGVPQLTRPSYPGPLPGGVRPDLRVSLAGLSREVLKDVYMPIELPELPAASREDTYPTIGSFYGAIAEAVSSLGPGVITGERQLAIRIGLEQLTALTTLQEVRSAITLVKEQGEGTGLDPEAPVSGNELAHFYKFGEIYHGKRYVKTGENPPQWAYAGAAVPFPEVWPMAEVPAGGYPALALERSFDEHFAVILQQLEEAWAAGGTKGNQLLTSAVGAMLNLGALAQVIMQVPLPSGSGTHGPDFAAPAPVSFEADIAPMLSRFRDNMMWRFDLAKFEHVRANASLIYSRVCDSSFPMPPPYYAMLSPEQIRLLGRWIDEGCAP